MESFILNIYQKLGDCFTGTHKKKPLYIGLLIIFILLFLISYYKKIIVDKNTLYWVFSSLVQALLALVALMGVVSIFKLQNLYNEENRILDESNNRNLGYFTLLNNGYSTIEDFNSAIDKHLSERKLEKTHFMVIMHNRIKNLMLSKKLVTNYAIKYTIFTFTVALLALFFLMIVSQISTFYLGINSLYLMFILTGYSLFLAVKGFVYSIKG